MASFRDVRRVDGGGAADVYVSHLDGVEVARKVLVNCGEDDLKRFRREIRAQSSLDHPRVVPILYADLDATPPWYAMPLYAGSADNAPGLFAGEFGTACVLANDAIDALSFAHSKGIIHRDLKPANLLIDHQSRGAVADFGLCRNSESDSTTITVSGVAAGTPWFSSPEQLTIGLKATSALSDIWS